MKNLLNIILFISVILISISTAHTQVPQNKDIKVGIALSGGGIRGIAHIGILRRLEEEGIKLDCISGSSMGSLIGGLYALGYDSYEIEDIIRKYREQDILSNSPERDNTENYLKKTSDRTVVELEFTPKGIELPNALNNGHRTLKVLRELTYSSEYYNDDFDKLKYSLRIVCTDIQEGEKVVFRSGDLPLIILGSMSFPGLFKPVEYGDMRLLDGGLTDNVPTDVLKDCDIIIASDATHDTPSKYESYNFIELLDRISVTMTGANVKKNLLIADVVFRPEIENVSINGGEDIDSLIYLGYHEAGKYLKELKELTVTENHPVKKSQELPVLDIVMSGNSLFSDEELLAVSADSQTKEEFIRRIINKYIDAGYIMTTARFSAKDPNELVINETALSKIQISGDTRTRKKFIKEQLGFSKGDKVTINNLESGIDNLYGTNLFHKVNYTPDIEKGIIYIHVEEKPYNVVRLGANYETDRGFLGLIEVANKNLHGKRAELYGGLTYGEKFNRVEISYYNVFMKSSTFFFELLPYYQIKEREFYKDHDLLEERGYKEERTGFKFNLGFQFFDNYQGKFTAGHEYLTYSEQYFNRTSGTFTVLADSRNDNIMPSKGILLNWNMETGMFDFDNKMKYQKIWWEFSYHKKIFKSLNIETGICGGTGDKLVPVSEKYSIGGSGEMPGTYYEEYTALQYFRFKLIQNVLLEKSTLFDVYFTLGYFMNTFWDQRIDEIEWDYREFINSFYFGLLIDSPLGPLQTGWGLTTGNNSIESNNRFFLSVGYPLR